MVWDYFLPTDVHEASNLCSIYDNRPLLCRIDDSYDIYFKDRYTKEEYYKLNYEVCKKLQVKGE